MALGEMVEGLRKQKFANCVRSRPTRGSTNSRYIPAEVQRTVWKRDGGKCVWPLANGEICDSKIRLELDHILPRALGGPSTVDNLRVICRRHNQIHAEETFGVEFMGRFGSG